MQIENWEMKVLKVTNIDSHEKNMKRYFSLPGYLKGQTAFKYYFIFK